MSTWNRWALKPGVSAECIVHALCPRLTFNTGLQLFVDVLDTERRWCLAEVLAADETVARVLHRACPLQNLTALFSVQHVTIHYHGWPEKFRETLMKKDQRLQEPLTKTGEL
jgi:hypothetical protein